MAWKLDDRQHLVESVCFKSSSSMLTLLASDLPELPVHCAENREGSPDLQRGVRYQKRSLLYKLRMLT